MSNNKEVVLSVKNLKQYFNTGMGKNKLVVKAIDNVSFDVSKGEVFGLVGESGCGKTTTGRTIIKIYKPTDGEVEFMGEKISAGTLVHKEKIKTIKKETSEKIAELKDVKSSKLQEAKDKNADASEMSKIKASYDDEIKKIK